MTTAVRVPEKPRTGEELRNNLLVALALVVFVGLGWLLKSVVESRSVTFTALDGALSVAYPASWVTGMSVEPDTLLEAFDVRALSTYHPTFRVQSRPVREGQSLLDVATSLSLRRVRSLREYQELESQEEVLAGQPAIRVTYGYVADPPAGSGKATLPVVVKATDLLVIHGGRLLIFTTASETTTVERYQRAFDGILRSVRLK